MEKIIQHLESAINYSVEGSGVTLVLLHGFCEDKTIWDNFKLPLLSKYKIITVDLPGFGKSLPGTKHISMEWMAEAVIAVLNEEQIENCYLLGHSMGGYVTLAFAAKHSARLNGIGLFHSSCFSDDETKKITRKKVADFVLKNGSRQFVFELFPTLFTPEYAASHSEQIQLIENRAALLHPEAIANGSTAMCNRKDFSIFLSETNLPVLMIVGKKDLAIPFEISLKMSHLPSTALICVLENSAHMGMLEEPDKAINAIGDWINIISN